MQSRDAGLALPGVPQGECGTRGRQAVPLHLAQLDHDAGAGLVPALLSAWPTSGHPRGAPLRFGTGSLPRSIGVPPLPDTARACPELAEGMAVARFGCGPAALRFLLRRQGTRRGQQAVRPTAKGPGEIGAGASVGLNCSLMA